MEKVSLRSQLSFKKQGALYRVPCSFLWEIVQINELTESLYRDIIIRKGVDTMPEIARFYGIIIKMFFSQKKHNPPHIHAIYGEYVGLIEI
mgnify:CR=1 FL=1